MVDIPQLEPPTLNIVSFAGKKRDISAETGRDGLEKETLWREKSHRTSRGDLADVVFGGGWGILLRERVRRMSQRRV
jgi:hypothetical protein